MATKRIIASYPFLICSDCGNKYGKAPKGNQATFYFGNCGWCNQVKAVTEPRDFGYPRWSSRDPVAIIKEWLHTPTLLLRAGELSRGEIRTVKAILNAILRQLGEEK